MELAGRIAWCGIGKLGRPIVRRLIDAGAKPILYDLRHEARDGFGPEADVASTAADAARNADFVFSTITDDSALEALALGPDGVVSGLGSGAIFCDLSTVSPMSSSRVAMACDKDNKTYLRSAISGSVTLAESGALTVFASGPRSAYDQCLPILKRFSATQLYVGEREEARVLKLLINDIAAVTAAVVAESIAFGRKAGVDYQTILDVIAGSVMASPLLQYKIDPLRRRDFSPTFTTRMMLKDLRILESTAARFGCDMPLGAASLAMFEAQEKAGLGDEDFFSGVKMMEQRAGLDHD